MKGHKLTIESDGTETGTKIILDGRDLTKIINGIEFVHRAEQAPSLLLIVDHRLDPPLPNLLVEPGAIRREQDFLHIEFG